MTQTDMLISISNFLDKFKVTHCLMFGTLLGVVRDKDFIPWDKEDIDLGIFTQFWKDDLIWDDFNISLNNMGYRVRDMAYNYMCIDNHTNLHVDLYLLLDQPKSYEIKVTGVIASFPKEDFDTLDRLNFKGKDFLVPHNPEEHLAHNYGPDWRSPKKDNSDYNRKPINNYKKITYTYIISEELP